MTARDEFPLLAAEAEQDYQESGVVLDEIDRLRHRVRQLEGEAGVLNSTIQLLDMQLRRVIGLRPAGEDTQ
jgi:hypothetical protein